METKKQLVGLLGMSFMQMLCTENVQAMHRDFQKRKRQRCVEMKKQFDDDVAILRPSFSYKMYPCFNPDGTLSYINIPLQVAP